jgi:hypothetical protein
LPPHLALSSLAPHSGAGDLQLLLTRTCGAGVKCEAARRILQLRRLPPGVITSAEPGPPTRVGFARVAMGARGICFCF